MKYWVDKSWGLFGGFWCQFCCWHISRWTFSSESISRLYGQKSTKVFYPEFGQCWFEDTFGLHKVSSLLSGERLYCSFIISKAKLKWLIQWLIIGFKISGISVFTGDCKIYLADQDCSYHICLNKKNASAASTPIWAPRHLARCSKASRERAWGQARISLA